MANADRENHRDFLKDDVAYLFKHTQIDISLLEVNMFRYTILAHKEVEIEGNNYELELKVCKPGDSSIITRVTLYSKQEYQKKSNDPRKDNRNVLSVINPKSDSDYVLADNELAFCYQNIILDEGIDVRSRLEVRDSMKRKGIGSSLFSIYETLARETVSRLKISHDKNIRLIIRDNSKGGWTQRMAEKGGYRKVGHHESPYSSFPTFVKYLE